MREYYSEQFQTCFLERNEVINLFNKIFSFLLIPMLYAVRITRDGVIKKMSIKHMLKFMIFFLKKNVHPIARVVIPIAGKRKSLT